MLNQQALDSLYSATYMEDYLDCMENLPNDIQRNISRMRNLDYQYNDYMKDLEAAMEDLMEEIDNEPTNPPQVEDEDDFSEEMMAYRIRRGKYVGAKKTVQELLIKAQDIGDEKLQLAQNVQDNIENKARQLELDKKNLGECTKLRPRGEYGREMENQDVKEDKPSGVKRARRAKHEVYVPSIMGPSTLEVTSFVDDNPGPSTSRSYNLGKSSTSNSGLEVQDAKVKVDVPDEVVGRTGGRGSDRNARSVEKVEEPTRASERSASSSGGVAPIKTTQKGNNGEKKGKKRKTTSKQSKSQEFSPPDDADTIDPDEPTYCLCDQISYGEMIGCDNDLCPIEWFHFSCVSLTHKPKGKWYCPRCRGDKPNVMKNRTVLIKELAKYNREREEKA